MRKVTPKIIERKIYEPVSYEGDKPKGKTKKEKVYPRISIPLSALPEAKSWKLDKNYIVTLELDMTGISFREKSDVDSLDDEYSNRADFNIVGVEVKKESKSEKSDRVVSRYNSKENEE